MKIRIGTRTSKMAMAQAKTVAALLQQQHPGLECEFVGITSSGDKDKKTPLWQMDVVGIFSRELDEQLLNGTIDCAVHSLKDLGTQRPTGLVTAAMLKRENPRDIAIFRAGVRQKIKDGVPLIIGSSAPRRMELIPGFLNEALPQFNGRKAIVQMVPLRGNVNSRLQKLHDTSLDGQDLDGIVVALAGLGRLNGDDEAHDELHNALAGLPYMVMPLTVVPGAPGQGTIVIERHASRDDLHEIFAPLHDVQTAEYFAQEQEVLTRYGGGCHQKFGVACIDVPNLAGPVTLIRGKDKNDRDVSQNLWAQPTPQIVKMIWSSRAHQAAMFKTEFLPTATVHAQAVFVAHMRALPEKIELIAHLWTSGVASWFQLAQRGLWVEGCADSFGFSFLANTLREPFLHLPPLADWTIYTHADAVQGWDDGHVVATYSLTADVQQSAINALQQADLYWWSSAHAYFAMKPYFTEQTRHACGPGKTADALLADNVHPLYVFPSYEACCEWAGQRPSETSLLTGT